MQIFKESPLSLKERKKFPKKKCILSYTVQLKSVLFNFLCVLVFCALETVGIVMFGICMLFVSLHVGSMTQQTSYLLLTEKQLSDLHERFATKRHLFYYVRSFTEIYCKWPSDLCKRFDTNSSLTFVTGLTQILFF